MRKPLISKPHSGRPSHWRKLSATVSGQRKCEWSLPPAIHISSHGILHRCWSRAKSPTSLVFISAPLPSQERPAPGEAHSPRRETADPMVWKVPDGAPGRDQQGQPLTPHRRLRGVGGGGVFSLLPPGLGSQSGEQAAAAKPTAAGSPLPTASARVTVAPGGATAPWGGGIWGRDQSPDYPWA